MAALAHGFNDVVQRRMVEGRFVCSQQLLNLSKHLGSGAIGFQSRVLKADFVGNAPSLTAVEMPVNAFECASRMVHHWAGILTEDLQSAGTGAGRPTVGLFLGWCSGLTCGSGVSHLRTSGSAARITISPARTRSFERTKSSYSNPLTSGSITRSAACFHTPQFISCAMAKHCPITSKTCRGPAAVVQRPLKYTASTRSAPISRNGTVGTACASMPSTSNRPRIFTGKNIPGYAQLARTGSISGPE